MFSSNSPTKRLSLPLQAKLQKYKKETIFGERNWKKMMKDVSSSL